MRLAFRLALTFGLLAAASSGLVGVAVRQRLVSLETERFRHEVGGVCQRIKEEVRRQAEADRTLITGFCEGGELVERVGLAIDTGEIDSRRLSFSQLVRTERAAFGMDELLVGVERGDIIGASPTTLIGMPAAEVDRLIRADPKGFVLRTGHDAHGAPSPPAIVTRCTKPSPSGRLVGMVAARHVDPMMERIAKTLDITLLPSWTPTPTKPSPTKPPPTKPAPGPGAPDAAATAGAKRPESSRAVSGAGVSGAEPPTMKSTCELEDGKGAKLPFELVKSTKELEANVAEVDRTVGVLAIAAAIVAFLVSIVLARTVSRPLAVLAQEAGKVAEGNAEPIEIRGSGEVRTLAIAFDRMLKDLAVTRRRLAAASRIAAWREVARRVAHEVKNPLAPIRAAVETLRRLRAREDPRFDEYFDEATRTVLDEVHRISNIVTEFTRFARLPPPRPQEMDVEDVARHIVKMHAAAAGDKHLAHVTQRRAPAIRADRDQVIQVLTNLVQNALDAVKDTPGGAVTLTTDTDGQYASFAVADNGPGVTPEFAGRLFEPYATTKTTGTGLGLAIAQRIAYEHNGELSYVGPSANGKGAVFRLVLPIAGPPPADPDAPPSSAEPLEP
ncbi:MAG: HAMP domain-containing protein [Labilithrix sp.]|nr:HAMP domain-containing protein [Labilithrix sp.]MCW5811746.1 HAMP domain-containing protein [Labilithrix sp.]